MLLFKMIPNFYLRSACRDWTGVVCWHSPFFVCVLAIAINIVLIGDSTGRSLILSNGSLLYALMRVSALQPVKTVRMLP